ncbi:MAG: serine/threonine protein kinase [Bacteroidota bacterium]
MYKTKAPAANNYGFQDLKTVREIGRGGFGRVDEVEDIEGQRFARKTFAPNSVISSDSHDKLRDRFKREIRVQSVLDSRWVTPILSHSFMAASPWFLMPLADGIFDQCIAEMKTNGKPDVAALINILDALQYLHDLGYVHRDLNPKNILKFGSAWKLADFGAVLPPDENTMVLTEETTIITKSYSSPEQSQHFHSVTTASDVYSMGCILHDIYGTGRRIPYSQLSAPGKVGALISKCTELDPKKRPSIGLLRSLLIEAISSDNDQIAPLDQNSEKWLEKLDAIDSWSEDEIQDFGYFFESLPIDTGQLSATDRWTNSSTTPFLTRLSEQALERIVSNQTIISKGVVEKYCDWVKKTDYEFNFADLICRRLCSIFDHGSLDDKARAFSAMVNLGETHNRWYVMRCTINRCRKGKLKSRESERLALELLVDGYEDKLKRCLDETSLKLDDLSSAIADVLSNIYKN